MDSLKKADAPPAKAVADETSGRSEESMSNSMTEATLMSSFHTEATSSTKSAVTDHGNDSEEKGKAMGTASAAAVPASTTGGHSDLPEKKMDPSQSYTSGTRETSLVVPEEHQGNPDQTTVEDLTEAFAQDIQALPSTHRPARACVPGAFPVSSPCRSAFPGPRAATAVHRTTQFIETQRVSEAHLVIPEDANDTCGDLESCGNSFGADEVVEGKLMEDRQERRGRNVGGLVAGVVLAICCVAGLVIFLVFLLGHSKQQQETDTTATMATMAPVPAPIVPLSDIKYAPFSDDLPSSVIEAIEEDVDGAFYRANSWVMNDPNLKASSFDRLKQRYYLALLYYATNGDSWIQQDDWLSYNVSECDWYSSSSHSSDSPYYVPHICDTNGTVINLSLANNNLTGELPIWYSSFIPLLQVFDVGDNLIGGPLPTITTTPYVEVITLSNNPFIGIPSFHVGPYLPNLKVIETDGIQIRGDNGGNFFKIIPLIEVYNSTGVPNVGSVWPTVGLLTHMTHLGYGHSDVNGTLPSELGLVTALQYADFSGQPDMQGTIPSEMGLLTQLTHLDLSGTPITGTVPAELCRRVQDGLLDMFADCSLLDCCN